MMPQWLNEVFEKSSYFMPHGHCYFWIPGLLWLHVISDVLIGVAYAGISLILTLLVRRIRLPFSPVFVAFGLFIGLCGLTHFMAVWTVWSPDYWLSGLVKGATAAASVATAIGLFFVRPQVEEVVHAARLSEERRIQLESTNAELEALYQKIKQLDELKTQFFANISHELRTPLALILGPTESLRGDANLTGEQKRKLESISRNGKSLLKQVNDLLDVAKLEEGKMEVQLVQIDLVPLFRRIACQFEMAAEQRDVGYHISAPESLMVEVDPSMIERILINLLSNAFKFTPQQGDIRVELSADDKNFHLRIVDTGPGIDIEQHRAIFERFRQADAGVTRAYGGTGLGLAIAKDFVELHGGGIDVNSRPGKGSEFLVSIPLHASSRTMTREGLHQLGTVEQVALDSALNELKPPDEHEMQLSAPKLPNRPTVLVVEDTPEMSELIVSTLSSEYNTETAFNGHEGLQTALVLQPDLIITDIMMPRMGGDQLVAELRTRERFNNIPILLLTAKADDDLRVHLLKQGAQDYLTKPFLPQELMARAGNLIAVKRAGDALRHELTSVSSDIEGLAHDLALKHHQLQVSFDATEVAREQAERASYVKSHFLAMISHELRTPLSTIVMSAQLLNRQAEEPVSEVMKLRLERMVRATANLSSLVEGILEYSRVESGKITVRAEKIDTVALAQEVIEVTGAQIPSPDVTLSLAPPPESLPEFVSDARLLRVVLTNVISNALKFTRQGEVTLRLSSSEQWFTFAVEDTGIGIADEDIPRIFLPFEQLEPVHRKSIPGVGLGLALTKEIVEALGGKVEVTSAEGVGSTFTILLPNANADRV